LYEIFLFLGGEELEALGLSPAPHGAESDNSPNTEITGDQAVEEVGLLVIHGGHYMRGGRGG
jgi:hypothetical protein